MNVINIFLTDPLAESLAGTLAETPEDFEHDASRFVFHRLRSDGPAHLVDGPIWIFVDWVMDDLAGLEMCRRLRADPRTASAHITMVLEGDDAEDRRRALKAGADDYMAAPLDRAIVLDRVLALQSPTGRPSVGEFKLGQLTIDMAAMRAMWSTAIINLRPNEFRLLRFFAENPNKVLSRADLIGGIGKQEPAVDERTVDVWVGRLRRALKAAGAGDPLRTIRSQGYVFDAL